ELLQIVREKVKPYRDTVNRESHKSHWWQYGDVRPGLRNARSKLERVLVNSQASTHSSFAFLPSNWIFSHALNVFALSTFSTFATLQSRVHEIWARVFGSSMKDDLRYTTSDCFETFPFPDVRTDSLETIGRAYYEYRASLMGSANQGLTKI